MQTHVSPPTQPARSGRIALRFALGLFALLLVLAASLGGVAAWLLGSSDGAARLLARAVGARASGLSGSLLGDLAARRIEIDLPADATGAPGRIVAQDLQCPISVARVR